MGHLGTAGGATSHRGGPQDNPHGQQLPGLVQYPSFRDRRDWWGGPAARREDLAAAVATIGSTEDFAQACYEGGAAIMAPVDMKPGSTTNTIKLSSMQEPPSAGGRAASESQRR